MYAQLESDVSEWYLNTVKSIRQESKKQLSDTSNLTQHQRLLEFLARKEVLNKSAPLQLIYDEIIRRSLAHDEEIAQRFIEQWIAYRSLINRKNVQRIKSQESMVDGFFDKFIGSITFNTALNNPMYHGSRYAPEFDTLIIGPSLVPSINRKRTHAETKSDSVLVSDEDEQDITKYVATLFTQSMAKAHINEMDKFVKESLDTFITGCVNAISETRKGVADVKIQEVKFDGKEEEEDIMAKLKRITDATATQWKEAFGEADPESKETQLALNKARDDADKLFAEHTELLIRNKDATAYISDYETEMTVIGFKNIVQPVIDVMQSCRTAYADNIKPPILLDWRKPGVGKRQRIKEETKEMTELTWLAEAQSKLETKMVEVASEIKAPYQTQRVAARQSAVMLDYANHLRHFDFSSRNALLTTINARKLTASYVDWILKHEADARGHAADSISTVRKQAIKSCDMASERILSIRTHFTQQIEMAKRTRQSADSDLQITIKGGWKNARITPQQRGELTQLLAETNIKDKATVSGETLSQMESSLQAALITVATMTLVTYWFDFDLLNQLV